MSLFAAFLSEAQAVRRLGSAALDLCYVAAGRMDGFWEQHLKPWDMAAGALMLAEAGGRISALDGGPFDLRKGQLMASNGVIHDALLDVVRRWRERRAVSTSSLTSGWDTRGRGGGETCDFARLGWHRSCFAPCRRRPEHASHRSPRSRRSGARRDGRTGRRAAVALAEHRLLRRARRGRPRGRRHDRGQPLCGPPVRPRLLGVRLQQHHGGCRVADPAGELPRGGGGRELLLGDGPELLPRPGATRTDPTSRSRCGSRRCPSPARSG